MIEKRDAKGNKQLIIGETTLSKMDEGAYSVKYETLFSEDLSQLNPGVKIHIDYGTQNGMSAEKPNHLFSVRSLEDGKVEVIVGHHRCACCWRHAMSYKIYNDIVESLFTTDSEFNESVYETKRMELKDGSIFTIVSLEVATGKYAEIEQAVQMELKLILQPIYDCLDQIDEEVENKFSIMVGYIYLTEDRDNHHNSFADLIKSGQPIASQ